MKTHCIRSPDKYGTASAGLNVPSKYLNVIFFFNFQDEKIFCAWEAV